MLGVEGNSIVASSPLEVIQCLNEISRHGCEDLQEFMEATAAACQLQTGAIIGTYMQEQFVEDLLHHGFLVEVPMTAEDYVVHQALNQIQNEFPDIFRGADDKP